MTDTAGESPWCPWHPRDLARRLARVPAPWCIAGGWALDLWHGVETRPHDDLEFAVLRGDLPLFRNALPDLAFHAAHDGVLTPLAVDEAPPPHVSQIWCRDVAARCFRVAMMIEPGTPATWVYRRDPSIACPRAEIVATTKDGIACLNPAAVLLFKAKHRRPKDEADFLNALPKLAPRDRRRLKNWLDAAHPGHEWARAL